MSCSSQIPPMNIAATKEKCSGDCSYTFDYGPSSSCVVAVKDNYLDIAFDGTAVVTFKGIPMGVAGARLYQPSQVCCWFFHILIVVAGDLDHFISFNLWKRYNLLL